MSSADGAGVWAGRISEAADSSCKWWPEWDRRDMFYNMWVRIDAPPQIGEGKGQSRERTSVSRADTDESLSASLRNPSQTLPKEHIKMIKMLKSIRDVWVKELKSAALSTHSQQFSCFFYHRNLRNIINVWRCYFLFMLTGKWDSSSSGYDFGTPVFHLTPHDSGSYLRVKAGLSRDVWAGVCLLWLQPWLLCWI